MLTCARHYDAYAIVYQRYTQAGFDTWQRCSSGPGLTHAGDLVARIRRRHGDYFSIGVAAFPEGHPESKQNPFEPTEAELDADVGHLKAKLDAGANFAICQFVFESKRWHSFVVRCRAAGITVPILPGIMPISEHASARLLSHTWAVRLPLVFEKRLFKASAADEERGREVVDGRRAERKGKRASKDAINSDEDVGSGGNDSCRDGGDGIGGGIDGGGGGGDADGAHASVAGTRNSMAILGPAAPAKTPTASIGTCSGTSGTKNDGDGMETKRGAGEVLAHAAHQLQPQTAQSLGLNFITSLSNTILENGGDYEGFGLHFFVYDSEAEIRDLLDALSKKEGGGWNVGCLR